MKLRCLISKCTIRQRLILLNYLAFAFILMLISLYSFQIVSLENKLVTMEQFDDLLRDILELRRYEKDILLGVGSDNVENASIYLDKIEKNIAVLGPKIAELTGLERYKQFRQHYVDYEKIFKHWPKEEEKSMVLAKSESEVLRMHGKALADTASELVGIKRENLSRGLRELLFWYTFVPAALVLGSVLTMYFQTRNVLNRLSSVQKATSELKKGNFTPIREVQDEKDEISDLIDGFNSMAVALEEKQEELLQSKKLASIGTFSSGIAHELNNPLNNISLSTDTLLEEYDALSREEQMEILEDIMAQTERASKIVKNLLDFSRIQPPEMQPIHLDYVLHKTVELIDNELRIHNIELIKDIEDMLPRIKGDINKLQQAFLNLLINAEQAMDENGTIILKARRDNDHMIRVDVMDTGPGIPPEAIDQIFDPFFTTKEAGKGTGLGLAIVYGIVKRHGGYIEVSSRQGKGTTFSVFLPVYRENQDKEV
ncbi:ATP-binding protein [Desulfolithobacter sp.]